MNKIEILIEKAYKNNKKIYLDNIIELNLEEEEYTILMNALKKANITVEVHEEQTIELKEEKNEEIVHYSNELDKYLKDISKIPLLTPEEEKRLFIEYKETGNLEVRKKIVDANLRLVVNIGKKYINKTNRTVVEFFDIIQDGNEGLLKAVEKFDVSLGYKFSTYASWWVKQSITRSSNDFSRTIRIPSAILEKYNRIKKCKENYFNETGIELTNFEVAKELNMKEEQVRHICYKVESIPVSLDEKVGDDSDSILLDFVPSTDESIEDIVNTNDLDDKLREIMASSLTEKEFFVISCRFGFVNSANQIPCIQTLEQVGEKLGVTRERIRQIEAKALRKIRIKINNNKLL